MCKLQNPPWGAQEAKYVCGRAGAGRSGVLPWAAAPVCRIWYGRALSQPRMWLCPPSFKLWGCVVPALYPIVLCAGAVPLLWRSCLIPEQNTRPVPPARNLLSCSGCGHGPLCVYRGQPSHSLGGQVFSQSVLPTDTVSQDPIISSCGLKGSCGPILLLLLASGQLVLGQCVFWSYLQSPVPSAPLCPPNPFSASAAPSPDPRQTGNMLLPTGCGNGGGLPGATPGGTTKRWP